MLKKIICLIFAIVLCFSLASCVNSKKSPSNIEQSSTSKEIYLLEGDNYTPYILVDDNYDGNILLLRKYVMDENQFISEYSAEYENSSIDNYLCTDFLNMFDDNTKEQMIESNIVVTSKESLYVAGKSTHTIKRKAFLLSFTETNCGEHGMAASEGKPLSYFSTEKKRIAYKENDAYSWWLRTPYTGYESVTWGINGDGARVELSSSSKNGIRPGITFSKSTEFILSNDIVDGKSVYVIK